MTSRLLYCLLILAVFALQACRCKTDYYYDLPASAFEFLPYDSSSSFQLQDSLSGAVNLFAIETQSLDYEWVEDCAECCANNYGETYRLTFRGDNPAVSISTVLRQEGYGGNYRSPNMQIWLGTYNLFEFFLDNSSCGSSFGLCHDSLFINGRQYPHVIEVASSYYRYDDSSHVNRLWYTKAQGILKYTTIDGQVWELMP